MSKFDKKTIATVLAFAALLGNKTSATTINPQTVGAVGGAASSHSKTPKETQGMGIDAKVAIGAAALVGAYATANEVLGDTGLVNHPAMGRFTAKKTIEYWMRDVKKEKELIDRFIEFIDNSGVIDILIEAKKKELDINLLSKPTESQMAELEKLINEILKNKDLISNIKIDDCPISLKTEKEQNNIKFTQFISLVNFKKSLNDYKNNLLNSGLSDYSTGILKFDLSKKSIFINIPVPSSLRNKKVGGLFGSEILDFDLWSSNITMLGNTVLTLNNDGSLTIKCYFKKFTDPLSGKSKDNVNYQITIPAPKNPAPKK
jgi:hypothetical protein